MQNIIPTLAVGSHKAGSGKGCAMNVISWENGDKSITDYPKCADRFLARIVQKVNDTFCTHVGANKILCGDCSIKVLALAHRTPGTAIPGSQAAHIYAKIARTQADNAASSAEYAAKSAEYAAESAAVYAAQSAAESARYAAESAVYAALYARSARYAAEYAAAYQLQQAHDIITEFCVLAGLPESPEVNDTVVAEALTNMAAVTA